MLKCWGGSYRKVAALLSAAAAGLTAAVLAAGASAGPTAPAITEFSSGLQTTGSGLTLQGVSNLQNIVAGPDGNLWFTDQGPTPSIGKITPSGTITEISAGLQTDSESMPDDIALGPDGNLWFTDPGILSNPTGVSKIGRITPGGTITEFTGLDAASIPHSITAGPDGNMWFTDGDDSRIGKITPSGTITEFTTGAAFANDIVAGPGGDLWFTDSGPTPAIGRITTSGLITEFSVGLQSDNHSFPFAIALGPDGNLWFADEGVANGGVNAIGRVTPAGAITEFTAGLPATSRLTDIAAGADGNLWFTDTGARAIGQITPAGAISEFSAGLEAFNSSQPAGIALGPNGNLWFADQGDPPAIGRVVPSTTTTPPTMTTTKTSPPPPPPTGKPTITAASQSNATWRPGPGRATFASSQQRKPPVGTIFSFTLNEKASVSLTFAEQLSGRKANGRCVRPTTKNGKGQKCKRSLTAGTLSFTGHAGANKVSFEGRISASRKLRPGSYTLAIVASASGKHSAPATLRFTVDKG
jgi:streptogramin lyase